MTTTSLWHLITTFRSNRDLIEAFYYLALMSLKKCSMPMTKMSQGAVECLAIAVDQTVDTIRAEETLTVLAFEDQIAAEVLRVMAVILMVEIRLIRMLAMINLGHTTNSSRNILCSRMAITILINLHRISKISLLEAILLQHLHLSFLLSKAMGAMDRISMEATDRRNQHILLLKANILTSLLSLIILRPKLSNLLMADMDNMQGRRQQQCPLLTTWLSRMPKRCFVL